MNDLVSGDLCISIDRDRAGGTIRLLWKGKSNDRQPAKVLGPYLQGILEVAAMLPASVELHFEQIEHFNSATISSIIQLIQDGRARGVKLIIVFDPQLKWQKLSFDALRVFAKTDGLLEIRAS